MKKKFSVFQIVSFIILAIASFLVLYPIILSIKKSLIGDGLKNYVFVWKNVTYLNNLKNSIIVVSLTMIGTVSICSLAAFAFSKMNFKGRDALFILLMTGMMIPTAATIFPLFKIVKSLHMVNNPISQVGPYITTNSIFGLLLLKIYYDGLPNEMIEAATIDGASNFQTFYSIMLPISIPGLCVLIVNTFLTSWNELLVAITFVSKPAYMTIAALPVRFSTSITSTGQKTQHLYACLCLCVAPVVIFYLCAQKMLINGMAEGAVKG